MDYSTSLEELNYNIRTLNEKIDELERDVTVDQVKINAHPVLFIVLLIGLFVTMDFWAAAAHTTLHQLHPRGYLKFWEYIILAVVSLVILLWIANKSGMKVRLLEQG